MKIFTLSLIVVSIILALIIFIAFVYYVNSESQTDIGGGAIDLDPDLSPSYAMDYAGYFFAFNSGFVIAPIMMGVISLLFIIPNIILRIKKIPPRRYMWIIAACILMFFGISSVENGLSSLTPERLEQSTDYRINLIGALIPIGYSTVFIIPAIIALKKAKLRKRK